MARRYKHVIIINNQRIPFYIEDQTVYVNNSPIGKIKYWGALCYDESDLNHVRLSNQKECARYMIFRMIAESIDYDLNQVIKKYQLKKKLRDL